MNNHIMSNIPLIISTILSICFIIVATTDTNMLKNSYFIYLILITLPIIITFAIWLPPLQINTFLYIIISIIILLVLFYIYLLPFDISILIFFIIGLFIISVFFGLVIYNKYTFNTNFNTNFNTKFETNLSSIIQPFFNKFNIVALLIIIILILIILSYLYNDIIMNYITNNGVNNTGNGTAQLILKDPISINTQTSYSITNPPTLTNYTFSFWTYVNNYPTSNYEIPIFKYGSFSPYITINNNITNNMNFYPSQYYKNNYQPIPFSVDTQKWNYIVIQYTPNTVELYLNALLIYSMTFDDTNIPVYMHGDNITIGDNNIASRGIGAISNINYYSKPLTPVQINTQYQILSLQNIPSAF